MQLKNFRPVLILLLVIAIFVSSCSTNFKSSNDHLLRVPAESVSEIDIPRLPIKITRAEFEKILQLSTEFLIHPQSKDVIRDAWPLINEFADDLSDDFLFTNKLKNSLLETQCIHLMATNVEFFNFVANFLKSSKKSAGKNQFKEIQTEKLKKINIKSALSDFDGHKPLPIILTDFPSGYKNAKMLATHDRFSPEGELIKAQDLVKEVKTFIQNAKSDITLNVYEFDLEDVARELIKAKARGVEVLVGIDGGVIEAKESVKKIYKLLLDNGINVQRVASIGLNHQKIIVRDAAIPGSSKVLLSSANFTKSDMHTNGDLGDLPLTHKNAIPNANHLLTMDSDALALIAKNELKKTLLHKLRGSEYPLSGSFQVMGVGGTVKKPPYFITAFTPNGGVGNINSNLIYHAIRRNCGDTIYMAQFAYSSIAAMEGIFDCISARKKKGLKTKLLAVGETPFAMQNWSMFLEMSGLEQKVDPATGIKFYAEKDVANFRELFNSDKEFKEFVSGMKIAPELYGKKVVELSGANYELTAKIHHKSISTGNMAIIGSSFNFSDAAERNQEQFFVFVDEKLAGQYRGIVTRLHQQSTRSVFEEASRRNEIRRKSFQEIKKTVLELSNFINEGAPLWESKKTLNRLIELTSEEEGIEILNRTLSKFVNAGHEALNFSFDWDDNIFFTSTKVIIYNKKTDEPLEVSTEKWAHVKNLVGAKDTGYEDYEIRSDSFINFRDKDKKGSNFLDDVFSAIDNDPEGKLHWKGPAWDSFVLALSSKKTAEQTTIITARGHEPKTIHRALKELKKRGLIEFVPPVENIWPVTNENFSATFQSVFGRKVQAGSVKSPSSAKAEVMMEILDQISKRESGNSDKFLSSDGKTYFSGHLWGFSDDDFDNFKKAREVLQPEVDKGRWPNIKITLIYTGEGHDDLEERQIVLMKKSNPRPATPLEFLEWRQAMISKKSVLRDDCNGLIEKLFQAF